MSRELKAQDWFRGFPLAVERREPQGPFEPHSHEFSEIVLITSGSGLHVTERESWPLAAGDVFVIGGPRAHEYRDMAQLCLVNVLFERERLDLQLDDLVTLPGYHALFTLEPAWRKRHSFESRLHLSPQQLSAALAIVERMEEELGARPPGFGFLVRAEFMRLIGHLSRCYEGAQNPDSRALLRIGKAISHLEKNYAESITVDELAAIAHMSRRSFIRAFEAAIGHAPIEYLNILRINHAASLLRGTDDTVTEIAFRVGFSDSNYFARRFHAAMGATPREYRKSHLPISSSTPSRHGAFPNPYAATTAARVA